MPATLPSPIHVLHVDDDPDFAELTATLLERTDDRFSVETATSAGAALDLLAETTPDCIVSDYNMPGTDGIEFLRAVREDHPDLPFFLYTGKGGEAVASEAISAGVTDYLRKIDGPSQYELLTNRIRKAVRARCESRQAARQEELMRLTEFAGDTGGFEIDYESEEITLTDGARRLTGLSEESYPLDRGLQMYPPADRAELREAIDRVVETGEEVQGTWEFVPPDGERRLLDITLVPASTDGATAIRGAVHDVTERTRRQRELEQIETLFRHAKDPLFLVHVGDSFTAERVNPAYEAATGLSAEEVCGKTPRELFGEAAGAVAEEKYRRCVEREAPVEYEEEVEIDGDRTYWETNIAPVVIDGSVEYIAGSTRNVTEQRQRERRFRALVEDSSDIISVVDREGRYQYQSPSLERILGYDPEETLGDEVWEYIHPDDRDDVMETFTEWVSNPDVTREAEYRVRHADGSWRWMAARGNNQFDSPVVDGYVINARDITEQKQRERALQSAKRQYQALAENFPDGAVYLFDSDLQYVRARGEQLEKVGLSPEDVEGKGPHGLFPRELADEQVRYFRKALAGESHTFEQEYRDKQYRIRVVPVQTDDGIHQGMAVVENITEMARRRQALERQNERLEEFASIVSHDLQNPLRVIRSRLELAAETCESRHLPAAMEALGRGETLIDDLLTLARENEPPTDVDAVSLDALATEVWATLDTDRATLDVETDCRVRASRSRLRQLLANLLGNAVDHSDPGVRVRLETTERGFFVADDGPGVPPDERESIFDAGYSTRDEGTGLGLRIVNQVATNHDWQVSVTESDEGGARFEISGVDLVE